MLGYQQEIAMLLLQYRIPAISELRMLIEAGGLFSYGPISSSLQGAWRISWTGS